MPFIAVPNVVEAELIMELFGQRIENTLYFSREAEWSPAQMIELGEALQVWWADQYAENVTADLTLVDVVVTDLSSDTAPSIAVPAPPDTTGLTAPPTAPGSVCITISFRTAGRGRSSRGRNYISSLSEGHIIGNDIDGGTRDAIVANYAALLEGEYLPTGVAWVVVSRYHDNAPRVTGISVPITSVTMTDTAVDTQRRRLRGRGD